MNYNITTSPIFDKEVKSLAKKYPSLKTDIQQLLYNIEKELAIASDLGRGFKKIRLNIKSKGSGKSGGGRIISFETIVDVENLNIMFASIYDKSEFDTIDIEILKRNLEF